jgi:arabinofuranosyltransferase
MRERPLWAAALLTLFLTHAVAFREQRNDDAFISYRYASNLAEGRGFVFNPGERVMASTSPGHVLLAAAAYKVGGRDRLPVVMNVAGVAAWIAQAGALLILLRGALGELGAGLVALALAAGCANSWNWIPLETNIAFALGLWTLTVAHRGRLVLAAVLAALAILFRADASIVAVLAATLAFGRPLRDLARPALAFAMVALPWPAFAAIYFGTPFPASLAAKVQKTPLPDYAWHALSHPASVLLDRGDVAVVAAAWLLAAAGAILLARRDLRLLVLPAWLVLHTGAYVLLRPDVLYTWHLYPSSALLGILALSSLAGLVTLGRPVLRTIGVAAVAVMVALFALRTAQSRSYMRGGYWAGARNAVYVSLAEQLPATRHPTSAWPRSRWGRSRITRTAACTTAPASSPPRARSLRT